MLKLKSIICGSPEGYDAWLLAKHFKENNQSILHIARDDRRMAATLDALNFYAKECKIFSFPAWDCPAYSTVSPNLSITSKRMATLAKLASNSSSQPQIVLTTLNAAMQRVPPRNYFDGNFLQAKLGNSLKMEDVVKFLDRAGYRRSSNVHGKGDFAVRGSILDVFPADSDQPLRLDFFGDKIDGIRTFNPDSQITEGRKSSFKIGLDKEFIIDKDSIANFRQRYRAMFNVSHSDDRIYRSVSDGYYIPGLEHWLPFYHQHLETIFDYLPSSTIFTDEGIETLCEDHWKALSALYSERVNPSLGKKYSVPALPPNLLHMDMDEFGCELSKKSAKQFVSQKRPLGPGITDAGGKVGRNFSAERVSKDWELMDSVSQHLITLRKSVPVMVVCWSKGSRDRFATIMSEAGINTSMISKFSQLGQRPQTIDLAVVGIEHGFVAKDLAVVSEQDIFGEKLVRRTQKKRSSVQMLAEASVFSKGDLVVHEENGIGRYLGLKTINVANSAYDCAVIEYFGGTHFYLPVININMLSRYAAGETSLDRLGSANWQERKARVKQRLQDIANELLRVAAERALQSAPIIVPEVHAFDSFLARFQFRETEDQLQAVEDVLKDMQSGSPMDRLICGDVGFGKTEVAMRAAFIAAIKGYQVAILAPTTLLVRQHFMTFRDRFAGFPIEVQQLSRAVTPQDVEATVEALAKGSCDIVIGTHALFAESVKFKNLGLLIVDEEQIFGVAQKEKLKNRRASVHVLSMTATPIPRTLQMALSGARDLSIISTPPVDRLAIRTYVMEFDPFTIRSAILHEFYRGGQCFILVPRVKDLPELENFLEENVPEVPFVVAHGRLPKNEMEARIEKFYDGKCKILLSTTIIASGIDIPLANTMIIVQAERFGLAQLYQIRGRVGRSGIRAYAYITYNSKAQISDKAKQRMQILSELDTLGAGFNLAAKDLDMRGGGNLLGRAQSGHVREVGVELYQKMLAQTVSELQEGGFESITPTEELNPRINLQVSALLPETYVSDLSLRLGLYRRIGVLNSETEIEGMGAELIDRFGALPSEVKALLAIVRIKLLCKQAGISRLDSGPKGATVTFQDNLFSNTEGLTEFINIQDGAAFIRQDKLVLLRNWQKESSRIQGATKLAKEILVIASV